MGSLPSPPRPMENFNSNYHICAVFCPREPTPNVSVPNWIELYNPSINTWTYVCSIPGLIDDQILKGFCMVSLRDSIYIIGGQICRKERVHVSDESADLVDIGIQVVSTVLRYNLRTNEWFTCAPLGVARYDFACTVCEDKIYVAGGKSTLASAQGISAAEVYDPSVDRWTPLPNLHILRYKCVGVTWQGKVYVIGGFAEREDCDKTVVPSLVERSSAEVYESEGRKWDVMAGMWQLDVPPNQIVAVNGSLLSSGDCLNAWKGHIEAYDGKLWNEVDGSHKPSLSILEPNHRVYLTMAPIGTQLYFLAGYTSAVPKTIMSIVHIFDTSASGEAWRSFEPMELEGVEKELCSHCCVVQL
ncbi:influenza virus NS1A-binding protein-like protein A-like [Senna tora]|uniref:Influenza virus NS1A-binding protein-like protein A-like n=1 Tax=Senna tora TaxID=362788 RepID=A0A834X8Y3_9FABA|nr:influenza virus NS1A-binding protein-like protein A-like [Senna tora]